MKLADLNDTGLQLVENRLGKFVKAIALKVIDQRGAEHCLIRALDESEDWLQDSLLLRLEVAEEVLLD